ncbi:hypothetical protein [Planctomycetes bacterium Poly30]
MCLAQVVMVLQGVAVLSGHHGNVLAGTIACALGTALYGWRLVHSARPVITMSHEGFRDVRLFSGVLRWSDIQSITTKKYKGYNYLAIKLGPGARKNLGLKPRIWVASFLYGHCLHSAAFGVDASIMQIVNAARETADAADHRLRFTV